MCFHFNEMKTHVLEYHMDIFHCWCNPLIADMKKKNSFLSLTPNLPHRAYTLLIVSMRLKA